MTLLLCLGVVFLLPLLYGLAWLWWEYTQSNTDFYTAPRMTPEEIRAAKEYAFTHYPSKPAKTEPTDETPLDQQLTEPEPELDPEEIKRQKQLVRVAQWEERKLYQKMAEAKVEIFKQMAIQRNFQPWLLELAEKRNIPRTYDNLAKLKEWVNQVLEVGQKELNGVVSVRSIRAVLNGSHNDTLPYSASRDGIFFLLNILEKEQLLEVLPDRRRKIPDDIFTRL